MNTQTRTSTQNPYLSAVAASQRARWEIDGDVLRGRGLDRGHKYLPDGLSMANTVEQLSEGERRFMSRVQGRTYANIFGLVERFINAKVLELTQHHSLGDQVALQALVRFSDEELKPRSYSDGSSASPERGCRRGTVSCPIPTRWRAWCSREAPGRSWP